jgi:hypothetical protein
LHHMSCLFDSLDDRPIAAFECFPVMTVIF